jgi:hypothetical protein
VFSEVAKKLKEKKFATVVRYTLKEEKTSQITYTIKDECKL